MDDLHAQELHLGFRVSGGSMATPFMAAPTPMLQPQLAVPPAPAPSLDVPAPDFSVDPSLTPKDMTPADMLAANPNPDIPEFDGTLKMPDPQKPGLSAQKGMTKQDMIGAVAQALAPGMQSTAKLMMRPDPKNLQSPEFFDLMAATEPFELSQYWAALMARDPGRMRM